MYIIELLLPLTLLSLRPASQTLGRGYLKVIREDGIILDGWNDNKMRDLGTGKDQRTRDDCPCLLGSPLSYNNIPQSPRQP